MWGDIQGLNPLTIPKKSEFAQTVKIAKVNDLFHDLTTERLILRSHELLRTAVNSRFISNAPFQSQEHRNYRKLRNKWTFTLLFSVENISASEGMNPNVSMTSIRQSRRDASLAGHQSIVVRILFRQSCVSIHSHIHGRQLRLNGPNQ